MAGDARFVASQQYQQQLMRFAGTEIASCNTGRTECVGRHCGAFFSTELYIPPRQYLPLPPTCAHRHLASYRLDITPSGDIETVVFIIADDLQRAGQSIPLDKQFIRSVVSSVVKREG